MSLNLSVATEDKQIARYAEAAGALPALRAAVERRVPARMRGDEDFVYEAKMAFSRRIDGIRPESIGAYASMTAHERLFNDKTWRSLHGNALKLELLFGSKIKVTNMNLRSS